MPRPLYIRLGGTLLQKVALLGRREEAGRPRDAQGPSELASSHVGGGLVQTPAGGWVGIFVFEAVAMDRGPVRRAGDDAVPVQHKGANLSTLKLHLSLESQLPHSGFTSSSRWDRGDHLSSRSRAMDVLFLTPL